MEPIMIFKVTVNPSDTTEIRNEYGAISIIPFEATVQSEIFTGKTVKGGADVQQENAGGLRNMSARYAFKGVDKEGNPCSLFVDNEGWIDTHVKPVFPMSTCPHFLCDSPILKDYFSQERFRAELHPSPVGVDIWVFDILQK